MKLHVSRRVRAGIVAGALGLLALSGCSASSGAAQPSGAAGGHPVKVGFFGYAASNSYTQGIFKGVKKETEAMGGTATLVDGQFDGQAQVQQINDAITSKQFDVIIITANDNLAVQEPLERAVKAGITVVVESTPVGPDFTKIDPQVQGAISVVYSPVANGQDLAKLAGMACKDVSGECQVAYMEGAPSLPLDKARTDAVVGGLKALGGNVKVLPTVTGGYTQDQGRTAYQNITQSNPKVNVVIGSTQAIAGAWLAGGDKTKIKFIGNGSPESAVQHVVNGEWYAIWAIDGSKSGETAAKYGIEHFQGKTVPTATDERELAPNKAMGTQDALKKLAFVSGYDE
ncbi:sugar ABC transporter substrate-binding protein [Microbacterium capsulatum]|uniref:Sugar ABC transporter substrate-binding protein n=1 Tax=Microbacterium capsulatum TaxID=3041921 RepID=A0ABU0XKD1_9MICO|nr:sugar ABC transporter substrate-binding protein [Microbacterium sp. ASV81]MDQ4215609.1 sugar ABC transporter substrate-binding protein [Microbacterium sp. ASV81]